MLIQVLLAIAIHGSVIQFFWGIWIATIAFKESIWHGLLCIFLPFYGVYYAISRWSRCKPLLKNLLNRKFIGSTIVLVIFGLAVIGNILGMIGSALSPSVTYSNDIENRSDLYNSICVTLGVLAYRSLKRRKLGLTKPSEVQQFLEIFSLSFITILGFPLFFLSVIDNMIVFYMFWVIIAYVIVSNKKYNVDTAG